MTPRKALQKAIRVMGSQTALAAAINDSTGKRIKTAHIYHWLKAGGVPAEHAPDIYAVTSERGEPVPVDKLCPSVNWDAVRA